MNPTDLLHIQPEEALDAFDKMMRTPEVHVYPVSRPPPKSAKVKKNRKAAKAARKARRKG